MSSTIKLWSRENTYSYYQKKILMSKAQAKHCNRHHLTNLCEKGTSTRENILIIDIDKHKIWHTLFHNLDLDGVIELLLRLQHAKESQRFMDVHGS